MNLNRIFGYIGIIINKLPFITKLADIESRYALRTFIISQLLAVALFFTGWSSLAIILSLIGFIGGISGFLASLFKALQKAFVSPAPSSKLDDKYAEKIISLLRNDNLRASELGSHSDAVQIAYFEELAFPGYSRSLDQRVNRIRDWTDMMHGAGQFILHKGESIGYSMMFPISERQAKRYLNGMQTEWGLSVSNWERNSMTYTVYANSLFIVHRHQGRESTIGLAQAATLKHFVRIIDDHIARHNMERSDKTLFNILKKTRIVADEFSLPGRRFMTSLGFKSTISESFDGRPIWVIDIGERLRSDQSDLVKSMFIEAFKQQVGISVN